MALPPTGLTLLLRGTPQQMCDALEQAGALTPAATADRQAVLDLIAAARRAHDEWVAAHPGWTGPNAADKVGAALERSPFLSEVGRRLA